jgi:hypothetical protein
VTASTAIPINRAVLDRSDALRDAFQAPTPLPGFVIVSNFLTREHLEQALAGCDGAKVATFCGHAPEEDPLAVRNEFFEPVEGRLYITIHQRPVEGVPLLRALHDLLVAEETLVAMESLTGIALSRDGHRSVLTSWGPWTFLGPHTDAASAGRPNRLIVSLSLTRHWDRRFGGITGFQWNGAGPTVWVEPRLNNAVIFKAFEGSVHWVEQIAGDAPDRLRYTFTMEYA